MSARHAENLHNSVGFAGVYDVYCRESNCLSVYNCHDKEKVAVSAPSAVIDYSLVAGPEDHGWVLYCLVDSGHIYRLIQAHTEATTGSKADISMNQEIFSELLPEKKETEDELDLQVATKPVYKLQSCDSVYQVSSNPVSLCAGCQLVAVTTENAGTRITSIFNEDDFCRPGNNKQPIKTFYYHHNGHITCNSRHSAILTKVITADLLHQSRPQSTDCISIHNKLFKLLFGQETALLVSPVLLLCPPEGSVFYAPIKEVQNNSAVGEKLVYRNDWQILCETESVVIATFPMSIKSKSRVNNEAVPGDNPTLQHCALTVISSSGLVTIIHANVDEALASRLHFASVMIASPVMAACVFGNRLYHSTGKFVHETTLQLEGDQKHKEMPIMKVTATKTFRLVGVNRLSAILQNGHVDTPYAPCQLVCRHVTGAETVLSPLDTATEPTDCSVDTGEQIKNILVAITAIDRERENVHLEMDKQNYWLRQVHVAAYLLSMSFSSGRDSRNNVGANETGRNYRAVTKGSNETERNAFTCKCQARLHRNDAEHKVLLDCKVTNEMPQALSHDWSIMVAINGSKKETELNNITKSIELRDGLMSCETVVLSVALSPDLLLQGCLVTISAVLLVHSTDRSPADNEENNMKCLTIPVHEETIDILYFLLSDGQSSIYKCGDVHKGSHDADVIQKMAESRPAAAMLINEGHSQRIGGAGITILVPCEVYMKRNGKYQEVVDLYGAGPAGILGYILKDSPGTISSTTRTQISLLTVLGESVYLSAEVNNFDEGQGHGEPGEVTQVKVTIRGGFQTTAALHRAIRVRLQHLCQSDGKPAMEVRQLRNCQQTLQVCFFNSTANSLMRRLIWGYTGRKLNKPLFLMAGHILLQEIDRDIRKLQDDRLDGKAREEAVTSVYQRLRSLCL